MSRHRFAVFFFLLLHLPESQNPLPAGNDFHLHPHYRAELPLEATLLKTEHGLDNFVTEQHADQIAAILAEWSAGLQKSSPDLQAIEKALAPDFSGFSPQTADSRLARSGPTLEVRQIKFPLTTSLGRAAFLEQLRSALSPFSSIETAEFQIVSIDADSMQNPVHLLTRVRYEFVGCGHTFHLEQRVGEWELDWALSRIPPADPAKAGDSRFACVAGPERNP